MVRIRGLSLFLMDGGGATAKLQDLEEFMGEGPIYTVGGIYVY